MRWSRRAGDAPPMVPWVRAGRGWFPCSRGEGGGWFPCFQGEGGGAPPMLP